MYLVNIWLKLYNIFHIYTVRGRMVIGISESLIWSKTLMDLIFNPCGEFW